MQKSQHSAVIGPKTPKLLLLGSLVRQDCDSGRQQSTGKLLEFNQNSETVETAKIKTEYEAWTFLSTCWDCRILGFARVYSYALPA